MSTPAGQQRPQKMQPDKSAMDIHSASHGVAMKAAQAHGDALTKLHAAIMAANVGDQPQPQQQQGNDYSNMPDPSEWVQNDPHGAVSYAEQIMQRLQDMLDQMAAPQGAPSPDVGAGPSVGGDTTGAY